MANRYAGILFEPSGSGGEAIIEVRSQPFKGANIRVR
jgi:hypothetical protein